MTLFPFKHDTFFSLIIIIIEHKLRIETGRHTVTKTPENLRICSFCHSDEVENEYYLLFSCAFYEEIRKNTFLEIHEKYSHFNSLKYF